MAKSLKYLSTAFNKENNVYKLTKIIDDTFDDLEVALESVRDSHNLNKASGVSLDHLGFFTKRRKNEEDDKFRARIKIEAGKLFTSGTINEIKKIIAAVLQTSTTNIVIEEPAECVLKMILWRHQLDYVGISAEELYEFSQSIKPAGIKLILVEMGTFTCRGIGEQNDPSKGYNDLNNSNPNAGTYAGLL